MDIDEMRLVSISVFLLSLVALLLYDMFFPPKAIAPESVTKQMIGKSILVRGAITYIKQGNTTFMKINRLPVVFFRNVSGKVGDVVIVAGQLSEYHGRLELVGKQIYIEGRN